MDEMNINQNTTPHQCGNTPQNPYYPPQPVFMPEYYEKKAVKRTANHIGVGLLLFYAFIYVVQIVLSVVFVLQGKENLFSDSYFILALNVILTVIGFIFAGILIMKTEKSSGVISFGLPKKGKLWPLVITGLGFCYVGNVVAMLIQSNLSWLGELKNNDFDLPAGPIGFLFSAIAIAAVPAMVEEFLFRGAIMGSLKKFGKPFAIFTSAVLFGLVHGNLVQIPFAFLVGLFLGWAVFESGSIWTGILIHFLNNFISVIMDYFQKYTGEQIANTVFMLILLIMMFLGFFGIYLLCRNNDKLFIFSKTPHISTSSRRFWWTMGSVAIVCYLVFVAGEVLLTQFVS